MTKYLVVGQSQYVDIVPFSDCMPLPDLDLRPNNTTIHIVTGTLWAVIQDCLTSGQTVYTRTLTLGNMDDTKIETADAYAVLIDVDDEQPQITVMVCRSEFYFDGKSDITLFETRENAMEFVYQYLRGLSEDTAVKIMTNC